MDKLKFRMFTWPENPEEYKVVAACVPVFTEGEMGKMVFSSLEPMTRVISGRGVFTGPDAVQSFNALAVMMATRTPGELVHPIWGTSEVFLTDLVLEQESRPEYIVYSFQFRETDEDGFIPWLPDYDGDPQKP